jgi:hypothetical protein
MVVLAVVVAAARTALQLKRLDLVFTPAAHI